MWSVFGLALRMAQVLGIDSDVENNRSTPFDQQMRRRLWWTLCWLEIKYAEDRQSLPNSITDWSDVEYPLDLNDTDISVGSVHSPQPRVGYTDMTLCLVRFEISRLFCNLSIIPQQEDPTTIHVKMAAILEETRTRIEANHLAYCDRSRPFDRFVLNMSEMLLVSTSLSEYDHFLTPQRRKQRPWSRKHRLRQTPA